MSGKDERPETSYKPIWIPMRIKRKRKKIDIFLTILFGLNVLLSIQVGDIVSTILWGLCMFIWGYAMVDKENIDGYWEEQKVVGN